MNIRKIMYFVVIAVWFSFSHTLHAMAEEYAVGQTVYTQEETPLYKDLSTYEISGVIKASTALTVDGIQKEWITVEYAGETGYIRVASVTSDKAYVLSAEDEDGTQTFTNSTDQIEYMLPCSHYFEQLDGEAQCAMTSYSSDSDISNDYISFSDSSDLNIWNSTLSCISKNRCKEFSIIYMPAEQEVFRFIIPTEQEYAEDLNLSFTYEEDTITFTQDADVTMKIGIVAGERPLVIQNGKKKELEEKNGLYVFEITNLSPIRIENNEDSVQTRNISSTLISRPSYSFVAQISIVVIIVTIVVGCVVFLRKEVNIKNGRNHIRRKSSGRKRSK